MDVEKKKQVTKLLSDSAKAELATLTKKYAEFAAKEGEIAQKEHLYVLVEQDAVKHKNPATEKDMNQKITEADTQRTEQVVHLLEDKEYQTAASHAYLKMLQKAKHIPNLSDKDHKEISGIMDGIVQNTNKDFGKSDSYFTADEKATIHNANALNSHLPLKTSHTKSTTHKH